MVYCMFDPPNAGKGTYGLRLSNLFGIPFLSTGKLLRDKLEEEEMWFEGRYSQEMMDAGEMAPADLVNKLVRDALENSDWDCVLDGFPRLEEQVGPFLEMVGREKEFIVISLEQPTEVLLNRAEKRMVCTDCGRAYAIDNPNMQPREDGFCIDCGGEVVRRNDDSREVLRHRMDVYEERTEPVKEALLPRAEMFVAFSPKGDDVDAQSRRLHSAFVLSGSVSYTMHMSDDIEITF